jgi:hypothetical protein
MYIKTNLPNGGRTQYFTFQYDSALSQARGVDFATSMMAHCDDDLAQLVSWFSGRSLDTVLPINVSIATLWQPMQRAVPSGMSGPAGVDMA